MNQEKEFNLSIKKTTLKIMMRKYVIFLLLMPRCLCIYAQKQTTPYFEFTYDCTKVNSSNNVQRNSWSYEYEDMKNNIQITVDVKVNPRGEDYPKELLDGMVMDLGYMKTTIGTFKQLYAAVSVGNAQGYYLKKATFNTKHRAYIVSVIGTNKEFVSKIHTQLEQTFITK